MRYKPNPTQKIETMTVTPIQFKPKIIGWIPYWDQENAFKSFSQNVSLFDFISVFWYRLDINSDLKSYKSAVIDRSIIDFAHKNNVKALVVVANLPDYEEGGNWDPIRVNRLIADPKKRSQHIKDLLTLIEDNNLDGIDIDYENLKPYQKENFSLFIEELAEKLHDKGKILGVAIHPKTSENNNPNEDYGALAQDLTRIANAADHLYFMTYTQNSISSDPGPLGSINWVNNVMTYVTSVKVPPNKIFLGIGLFGLGWNQDANGLFHGYNDDLSFNQIQSIIDNNKISVKYDNKVKSPYFEYTSLGKKYIVWFENSLSVSEKLKLAKKIRAGGIALWRLGKEDPLIIDEIMQYKNKL